MIMKKLLLATACLFVLSGQAYAAPCNAKVQTLQKQVDAAVDRTDEIINKCSSDWFEATKRYLELTRQYEEAAQRDKGCKINPPDMMGIALGILEDVKRTCSTKAKTEKPAKPNDNIWTDYVEYKETPEEKAELKRTLLKWEKESRREVPKTKPVVQAAVTLVLRANALLKGDPTCSQMRAASNLLDKAGDVYSNSNAKEAGDGTLRTLARRVAWLEDRADEGECRK
jgi:hypothetical protein